MSKPSRKRAASAAAIPAKPSGFFFRVCARHGKRRFGTPLGWLLTLLLAAQLVGASAFVKPPQELAAQASGLSSLSAALGEPVPICSHGNPDSPAPSMPSDCGHCTLCHLTAGDIALLESSSVVALAAVGTTAEHPPLPPLAAPRRRAGSTSPRGPPSLV